MSSFLAETTSISLITIFLSSFLQRTPLPSLSGYRADLLGVLLTYSSRVSTTCLAWEALCVRTSGTQYRMHLWHILPQEIASPQQYLRMKQLSLSF